MVMLRDPSFPSYSFLLLCKEGKKKPTLNQIAEMSRKLHIPFGFFLLKKPVPLDPVAVSRRTIGSISSDKPMSAELRDTINRMKEIQDWIGEHQEEGKLSFPGTLMLSDDIRTSAMMIRKSLAIDIDWHGNVRNASGASSFIRNRIGTLGIYVFQNGIVGVNTHRTLDLSEFRAFSIFDEIAPLIFINSRDSDTGRLFSLFHELVHIGLGVNGVFRGDGKVSKEEVFCNAVAAELVLPEDSFESAWVPVRADDAYPACRRIGRKFCCSPVVVARRALDRGLLSADRYTAVEKQAREDFESSRKKAEGGSFIGNQLSRYDHAFLRMIDRSIQNGDTQYTEAFRLTDTWGSSFSKLISGAYDD